MCWKIGEGGFPLLEPPYNEKVVCWKIGEGGLKEHKPPAFGYKSGDLGRSSSPDLLYHWGSKSQKIGGDVEGESQVRT